MQNITAIMTALIVTIFASHLPSIYSVEQDEKQIVERIQNYSKSVTSTTEKEPTIFAALKFEENVLSNLTEDTVEKIKANVSQSTAEYMNNTIDKLYQTSSGNGTISTGVFSIRWIDDIIEILGLFF